jgi:hypothetical protein
MDHLVEDAQWHTLVTWLMCAQEALIFFKYNVGRLNVEGINPIPTGFE